MCCWVKTLWTQNTWTRVESLWIIRNQLLVLAESHTGQIIRHDETWICSVWIQNHRSWWDTINILFWCSYNDQEWIVHRLLWIMTRPIDRFIIYIYMWRGGRGKAERTRGRAGSETSGESVGKWIMINTCIWFQWLPGRLEKAPAGLQWGGSNEQRERESPTAEEEQNHHRRRAPEFCLRFWYSCFILCY